MTIKLFSGIPGSGKTLYVVSELKKVVESNITSDEPRKIYSDITGLKISDIEEPPIDWRQTPPKSLLIYDEAQLRDEFKAHRGSSKHDFIQNLTIHRKTGHEIWFITQDPKRLHNDILEMVEIHYHLERPYGAKLATIYQYRGAERNPRGVSVKERAENKKLFNHDKSLYELYESSQVEDGIKFRLPRQLTFWLFVAIAIPVYLFYNIFYKDDLDQFIDPTSVNKQQSEQPEKSDLSDILNQDSSNESQKSDIQKDDSNNEKVKIDEYQERKRIYYNSWLPKDYEIIRNEPALRITGIMKMGNKCNAYNTFGDLMTLTLEECNFYLKNGLYKSISDSSNQIQNVNQELNNESNAN